MNILSLIPIITGAQTLVTSIIELIDTIDGPLSSADAEALNAALADLQGRNSALHERLQAKLAAAAER